MNGASQVKEELRDMIRAEAECARKMGWSRQRLNKITTGKKMPDIAELNCIAAVLERNADELLHIFLAA